MSIIEISEEEFEESVLMAEETVCVMFYADWAGPVHKAREMLKKVKKRSIKLVGMNIDENPHTPFEYALKAIPSFYVFEKGKPVRILSGAVQPHEMEEFLHGTVSN